MYTNEYIYIYIYILTYIYIHSNACLQKHTNTQVNTKKNTNERIDNAYKRKCNYTPKNMHMCRNIDKHRLKHHQKFHTDIC